MGLPVAGVGPGRFTGRYARSGAHVDVTLRGDGVLHLTETRTGDMADEFPRFEVDLVPVADGRFVGWLESGARWTPVTFADDRFVYIGLRAAAKLSP